MNPFSPKRRLRRPTARIPGRSSTTLALLLCAFLVRGQTTHAQSLKSPVLPSAPLYATPNVPTIGKITVRGTRNVSTAFVLSASGHKVGDPCTPQTLDEMRKKLFATGYFGRHSKHEEDAVKVTSVPSRAGVCQVTITVDENQLLTGINLTGTGPVKPDEVISLLHLIPGKVYNDKQVLMDALDIQQMYQKEGYLATLESISLDTRGILSIPIEVARVSEINVIGSKSINPAQIVEVMQTKVGDFLNTKTVAKDQDLLRQLPSLKSRTVLITNMGVMHGRVKLSVTISDPMPTQDTLNSPLITALMNNDTKQALALVNAGADPNTPFNNRTAFFLACGADWDDFDRILVWAAASPAQALVVEAMLTHGAKVNATDKHGRTPLMWAVNNNRPQTIDVLFKQGASVNIQDEKGETALYLAVYAAVHDEPSFYHVPYKDLIPQLMARGANPTVRNNDGITPFKVAQNRHRADLVALLRRSAK